MDVFANIVINKRKDIFFRAKAGEKHFEKIIHYRSNK